MQEPPNALSASAAGPSDAHPRGFPEGLLPHTGRALLLDSVIARTPERAEATASIAPDHPYALSGLVETTLAVELFAQTAALVTTEVSGPPRRGRLAAAPELELMEEYLPVGSELTVEVQREGDHGALTRFSGVLLANGRTVARGVIVVAVTNDDTQETSGGAVA